jgi:beta-phosphoglucomutase-like phosphatase (HAD superfamily)
MVSAHVEGVAKPDPRLFLMAAEMLSQPPGTCVVVEDSATGCMAARAAGMRCLGFARDGGEARLAAEGAFIVRSMDEVARELGL